MKKILKREKNSHRLTKFFVSSFLPFFLLSTVTFAICASVSLVGLHSSSLHEVSYNFFLEEEEEEEQEEQEDQTDWEYLVGLGGAVFMDIINARRQSNEITYAIESKDYTTAKRKLKELWSKIESIEPRLDLYTSLSRKILDIHLRLRFLHNSIFRKQKLIELREIAYNLEVQLLELED